jgi:hypothetical protein
METGGLEHVSGPPLGRVMEDGTIDIGTGSNGLKAGSR